MRSAMAKRTIIEEIIMIDRMMASSLMPLLYLDLVGLPLLMFIPPRIVLVLV